MTNDDLKTIEKKADFYAIGELFFVLLPVIVIIITFCAKGSSKEILRLPEWSLLASVMFGQSIIKNIHAIGKSLPSGKLDYHQFGTVTAAILVLGLIPSLAILLIIYILDCLPTWVYVVQLILFIIASALYYFANGSNVYAEERFKPR